MIALSSLVYCRPFRPVLFVLMLVTPAFSRPIKPKVWQTWILDTDESDDESSSFNGKQKQQINTAAKGKAKQTYNDSSECNSDSEGQVSKRGSDESEDDTTQVELKGDGEIRESDRDSNATGNSDVDDNIIANGVQTRKCTIFPLFVDTHYV